MTERGKHLFIVQICGLFKLSIKIQSESFCLKIKYYTYLLKYPK